MNLETINQELKQKFKKMSLEQFDEYVRNLRKLYLSQHPRYEYMLYMEENEKYMLLGGMKDEIS